MQKSYSVKWYGKVIIKGEQMRICNEATVACFRLFSQNLPEGTTKKRSLNVSGKSAVI